jgi:beta-galactosidase
LILPKLPHLIYGGDYNPEQWPQETWLEDMRLMQEAGVNLVSLGIFSWSVLEPRPGEYSFDWLDRVMDLLHEHEIMAGLATATASPPPWFSKLHPESLPVTREGVTLWPGSRQHYCPSSSAYRQAAARLARKIAERYRDHPALALWHVNNEYGCHVWACYCETSAAAFRDWLRRRYGTLDALNEAWGTAFWSQRYADWVEILPPRSAPTFVNPTQQLDFARFCSDELLACFEMERAILKEVAPDVPVTTNFMGFYKHVNYWTWASRQDVVSLDSYPDPADPEARVGAAMSFDLMRSLAGGKSWLLMEQTPSSVNWRPRNVPKRLGQMRLWSYQALARGADGVMFFQWRQSRMGGEKFHGAMVPHGGTDTRTWREVIELGRQLRGLDELQGARNRAQVAIVFDWENWWALELESKPSCDVRQMEQVATYYEPLYRANIPVDFVRPAGDFSPYRVILVPNLYLVFGAVAANLEQFAMDGGTVVMSFFSGIVDANDHILLGGYPQPFRRLLGLRVEAFDPFPEGKEDRIRDQGGQVFECAVWADAIDLEGAESIATYERDSFQRGGPAVTRHAFGQGWSYYLGTRPDEPYMALLLERVCREQGVAAPMAVPEGVEVVERMAGERTLRFLLNHHPRPRAVPIDRPAQDVPTGKTYDRVISLDPYGVAIVHEGDCD